MKNKLLKLASILSLSVFFVACANESTNDDTNKEVKVVENSVEEVEKEEIDDQSQIEDDNDTKKEDTTKVDDQKDEPGEDDTNESNTDENNESFIQEDGIYSSTFLTEVPEDSMIKNIVKEISINSNTLTVNAGMDYRKNSEDIDKSKDLGDNTYQFKLDENTMFQAVGGLAEPKIFTEEEFLDYCNNLKDSGLALIIEVKDGVATYVYISS